jgi:FkbM family methyltransferase
MKSQIKRLLRAILRKNGHDLVRRTAKVGSDPFEDMAFFVAGRAPLLVDVGGNIGQTVTRLKKTFPGGRIHSFEPSPSTFEVLRRNTAGTPDVTLWNCGVGAEAGRLRFFDNTHSDMSSFLQPSRNAWGEVDKEIEVEVVRLDDFARDNAIDFIDVLKSDTQGFEEAVFQGADQLLTQGRIGMVYFEAIVSDMYKGLPSLDGLIRRLVDRNYRLVSIYDLHHQGELASWMDALFIHADYYAAWERRLS